ncbi:peptidyl-prolyl cis-trans isomerase FKBP20 [Salix suchowensis]|nr:peptidyl-prolyl cis-trans isomerase FKBP20 [Salix suchowensis]
MSDSLDLSGDGGVVKTILRKAKADALCPSEDLPLVDVHYEGTLAETGEVFDTTRLDNTVFSFELGKGSVIQAWEIAVKTMKVGEVAKITCKPEFAYGSAGSLPDIPPGYLIIRQVELVKFLKWKKQGGIQVPVSHFPIPCSPKIESGDSTCTAVAPNKFPITAAGIDFSPGGQGYAIGIVDRIFQMQESDSLVLEAAKRQPYLQGNHHEY